MFCICCYLYFFYVTSLMLEVPTWNSPRPCDDLLNCLKNWSKVGKFSVDKRRQSNFLDLGVQGPRISLDLGLQGPRISYGHPKFSKTYKCFFPLAFY